jgi:hypothetical protein
MTRFPAARAAAIGVIVTFGLTALAGCVGAPSTGGGNGGAVRHPSSQWTAPENCGFDGSATDAAFTFLKQTPWAVLESAGFVPDCYWWLDKNSPFLEESSPPSDRFDNIGFALIAVGYQLSDESYFTADTNDDGNLEPATSDSPDLVKATRYYTFNKGGVTRSLKVWAYLTDNTLDLSFAVTGSK